MRRERRTIEAMVRIYCRGHHGLPGGDLCEGCRDLLDYAHARLGACRYQERKPTCGNCPRHCYKPSMKERVIRVMGYAGPRMTLRHPIMALMHLIDGLRPVPPVGKADSERRQ
jgi:predicted amidophosphoribosyltransferase